MSDIPKSYEKDKEKAAWMADAENDAQTLLARKVNGEVVEGPGGDKTEDELRGIIKESEKRSAAAYDVFKEGEKQANIDDYLKEHPSAVVDEGEAMAMASATKPEEEEILRLKKSAVSDLGQVGILGAGYLDNDPHLANAEAAASRAKELRDIAEEKASRVSDVYKDIENS